jgi:hypothetical protein
MGRNGRIGDPEEWRPLHASNLEVVMKRALGLALAGALLALSAGSWTAAAAGQAAQQSAPAAQKLTFNGDVALWTVAIKPDRTADFEKIMSRVRDALMKSSEPDRRRQAEGWKVMRLDKPMPDGNIPYVHIISPVVTGADYTVMQILYDAYPEERQALYETYRGAFAQNLSLASGTVAIDLAKPSQTAASSTAP